MSTTTFNVQNGGIQEFVLGIGSTKASFITSIMCNFDEVHEFRGKLKHRYQQSCKGKLPSLVRLHVSGTDPRWLEREKIGLVSMLSFVTGGRSLARKVDVTFGY